MAGPDPTKTTDASTPACTASSFSELSTEILNATFYNIIHDIVAKVHRDEKLARMKSAVVLARQKAEAEAEAGGISEKKVQVETEGAICENGKVYLKGNPLATTKEILCPFCRLPRLLYPTMGVGARPPPDPSKEYCTKHPLVNKPGYDVHGNPFASDKTKKKKKVANTNTNTPISSPPSTPDANGSSKQNAPDYPTIKCPNCPRYCQTNRVAAHLDRCMGISGRTATRNRDGGSATPSSNAGPPKRPLPEDDATPVNFKKKKPNTPKKPGNNKPVPPSKLKRGTSPDTMIAEEAAEAAEAAESGESTHAPSVDDEEKAEA